MEEQWQVVTDGICEAGVADKWWTVIKEKFSSKERTYYNDLYLTSLISLFNEYKEKLKNPQAVMLAIFFHK